MVLIFLGAQVARRLAEQRIPFRIWAKRNVLESLRVNCLTIVSIINFGSVLLLGELKFCPVEVCRSESNFHRPP